MAGSIASTFVALLVAGPLLALPASFLGEGDAFDEIATSLLPEALLASLVLGGGRRRHPDPRWRARALVLLRLPRPPLAGLGARAPAAVPGYVLVFVLLGQYDEASRSSAPFARSWCQTARYPHHAGPITMLTLVLYPYVYTLGRSAFLASHVSRSRPRARSACPTGRRCAGRTSPGSPRAQRRRRARRDGGVGRLRCGQPARLPRADGRDLPGLVRHLRSSRGPTARDGFGRAGADARPSSA